MTHSHLRFQHWVLAGIGALLVAFLALPFAALLLGTSLDDLRVGLSHPLVWSAMRLSLMTTSLSLAVVLCFGTPLAFALSRSQGRIARAIETALQLPIVVPPAVAGFALLLAFGRRSVLGGYLFPGGWSVAFTTAAVVMAEVFVSAPFYVQAATSAFRGIDPQLVVVARTFGANPFRVFLKVALPLAAPGIAAGAAMSWARALGEFGATLMFAGNLQGRTQTLPLAIYTALESDVRAAQALSVVLVIVAFVLLISVRFGFRRRQVGAEVRS